jgi:hypothetical protein
MTDAEIIKALEYCKNQGFVSKCCECRYKNSSGCVELLITDALDLINRQKAEIERLETEYESVYEQARADILGNMADGGTSCHWCIEQHKAEAIKEFAERLKERKFYVNFCRMYRCVVSVKVIDNLVKEMVGDAE